MRDKVTMHFPNPQLEYHLYLEANGYALGTTLNQKDESGRDKLICCLSKKLNSAEHNYPVHEREFLALLTALKKWKHYLGGGAQVVAHTDNIALRHWTTAPNLSPRVIRWIADVESFNITFEHIPGTSNTAADALSRLCPMIASDSDTTWLADYKADPVTCAQYFSTPALDRLQTRSHLASRPDCCPRVPRPGINQQPPFE